MKKIILTFVGFVLLILTIHFSMPFYDGVPGIITRIQARAVDQITTLTRDPGRCALIRGFWWKTLREKLRKRCLTHYIQNTITEVGDCKAEKIITNIETISHFWLRDEYRQRCLIGHYQIMLWNSLTREWLPEACLLMRDKLVIFENYFENTLTGKNEYLSDLTDRDISVIEQCEWLLDTPQIYSYLRDITPSVAEKEYIESQKQRVFELK